MAKDEVLEILFIVNLPDNVIKTPGSSGAIACCILQRADGQALSKEQFLVESCYRR